MQLCSLLAKENGLDPAGYAASVERFFMLENPLPWPKGMWFDTNYVPATVPKLFEYFGSLSPKEQVALSIRPLMVAPDLAYTPEGYRRFFLFEQPQGAFANYRRTEYLVPEERLSDLIWTALVDTETLPDFGIYRVHAPYRDFLVCTQGAVDAACGKFGYQLYQQVKKVAQDYPDVRIWRAAHFGGHMFAPTVLELPSGRCWAHLGAAQVEALFAQAGDIGCLDGHYRGWAGLDSAFLQVAEKELMLKHGWSWLSAAKRGWVVRQDEHGAEVCIEADGVVFEARVSVSHTLETPGSSGAGIQANSYKQYSVKLAEFTRGVA